MLAGKRASSTMYGKVKLIPEAWVPAILAEMASLKKGIMQADKVELTYLLTCRIDKRSVINQDKCRPRLIKIVMALPNYLYSSCKIAIQFEYRRGQHSLVLVSFDAGLQFP